MNRRELVALLTQNMDNLSLLQAVFNLLCAFVCTIIIFIVYYYTSKDTKPTAAFAKTILIVALSTCLVLMLVGSNLALSLGMVGALSIIRFRAAVKDSRDAAFVLYAIAAAMISALGVYTLAIAGTLFIGATAVIFSLFKIGARTYMLTVITSEKAGRQSVEEGIRKAAGKSYSVVAVSSKFSKEKGGSVFETIYEIGIKKGAAELCEHIMGIQGVESVNAISREDV